MEPITFLESASKLSSRGAARRMVPAAALVLLTAGLIRSGATAGSPKVSRVARSLEDLSPVGGVLLLVGVAATAVFLAPMFSYGSNLMKSSTSGGILARPLASVCRKRAENRRRATRQRHQVLSERISGSKSSQQGTRDELEHVELTLSRMPLRADMKPTILGNVLASADEYSLIRYGLDARLAMPRLLRLAPPEAVLELRGLREDIQFATELTTSLALGLVVSAVFLGPHRPWFLVPIAFGALMYPSYRNAVAAGVVYGEAQRVFFDLYRKDLYAALGVAMPATQAEEREVGHRLSRSFYGYDS